MKTRPVSHPPLFYPKHTSAPQIPVEKRSDSWKPIFRDAGAPFRPTHGGTRVSHKHAHLWNRNAESHEDMAEIKSREECKTRKKLDITNHRNSKQVKNSLRATPYCTCIFKRCANNSCFFGEKKPPKAPQITVEKRSYPWELIFRGACAPPSFAGRVISKKCHTSSAALPKLPMCASTTIQQI